MAASAPPAAGGPTDSVPPAVTDAQVQADWEEVLVELDAVAAVHPAAVLRLSASATGVPGALCDAFVAGTHDGAALAAAWGTECSAAAGRATFALTVRLCITPAPVPAGVPVTVNGADDAVMVVERLPPVKLTLRLAPGYPSSQCPSLELSATWLGAAHLRQAGRALVHLWRDGGRGMPVLLAWVEWLRSDLLHELDLERGVPISEACGACVWTSAASGSTGDPLFSLVRAPHSMLRVCFVAYTNAHDQLRCTRNLAWHRTKRTYLSRESSAQEAVQQPPPVGLDAMLEALHEHDRAARAAAFDAAHHECRICFASLPGHAGVRLTCGHWFCTACLTQLVTIAAKEADLAAFCCPEPECRQPLAQHVVRRLLPPADFERWDNLVLQRSLEVMPDIGYCPRCSATCPLDGAFGQCPKCHFAFCSLCRQSWHPGRRCMSPAEQLALLEARSLLGDRAAQATALVCTFRLSPPFFTTKGFDHKTPIRTSIDPRLVWYRAAL